ncbi:34189_t:CDS:2, partial [Racocetra persica]
EEMHIDYHNRTFEDACDRSCLEFRIFARVDDKSGPFEFGELPTSHNAEGFNQHLEEQKKIRIQTIEDIKEQIKLINEIVIDAFVNSGTAPHIINELYNTIHDSQKKSFKRCFTPCNIYIYGYNENKVFVFDDFYNHNMEFSTLLTLIDNKPHTVQKKDTLYFGNETVKIENKRKYSSIYNRFDYIIEYKKFRNDDVRPCAFECLCCLVKRIFHKGLYENFVNLRFDIEFNSGLTLKEIAYIVEDYKEDKIDYEIEELDNNDEKYDSDSSLSSNDSEATRRRKKGKAVS